MHHIPADVLQKLKQSLLDTRKRLLEVQKNVDEENPVHDPDRINDNASPDTDASEEVNILSSEVFTSEVGSTLARVDAALKRMDEGTYGHTPDGQEIPVERLLADPTATTLVA